MKTIVVFVALCAVGQSVIIDEFYPWDRENDHQVPKGDNTSSAQFQLSVPIVFYDSTFNEVSVNTDGYVNLGVVDHEESKGAILAPFKFELDGSDAGSIYYQEHTDKTTLSRATADVRRAFEETATTFEAKSVFVATWINLQSTQHVNVNFTFQCIVASNGFSSYAIFLYPIDELAAGKKSEAIRNQLTARAGFSDNGDEQLEVLSATELLEGGNAWSPGKWIFQIGGVLLTLDDGSEVPPHHLKAEPVHNRRQSGFEVSEVNFNEDYSSDGCEELQCDRFPHPTTCSAFTDGYCCQCGDGYIGNGDVCIQDGDDVRYNGRVSGYVIMMTTPWSNETAPSVDVHAYAATKLGRVFTALNGELSPELFRALQPMVIFGSTLGWIFARAQSPAINGFQFSGGKIVSETYIRYTTGAYEFRIKQEYDHVVDDEENGGNVVLGRMTFSGRLPPVGENEKVVMNKFTQIYRKSWPGSIRSRDTRTYKVGDTEHSYSVDQSIKYEGCEASFQQVPTELAVDVTEIYINFSPEEKNLRFAMDNVIRPAEEVGVRPSEAPLITEPKTPEATPPAPTPAPIEPEEPEPTVEIVPPGSQTICERELAQAERYQRENPGIVDEVFFPTCTQYGTFAPRQCISWFNICWCVDEDTGTEIDGTRTKPSEGYQLDCSDVKAPPPEQTPCQEDRSNAEAASNRGGSEANSVYMPRCMESGAYEPVQQLPDGAFMCVDFEGEEISRSTEKPECLTPCQLQAYVAESNNIFLDTDQFVVKCEADGRFSTRQCVETYCYCVDENGLEIENSRVETTFADEPRVNCDQFIKPVVPETVLPPTESTTLPPIIEPQPQEPSNVGRLLFAQTMGINVIDLPVTRENSVSRRLIANSDQNAVALAYDCSSKTYYWTDVAKRRIYSSILDGDGSRNLFVSDRIRSPEGISVDFITGNVYWTDSVYDRIEVASADGSNRMTLVSEDLVNPRGIAVDPIRGRMYWTDWNRKAPKIWIADMDGSNKRVLLSEGLGLPNDITIDFYYQRVCFVDAGTFKVECMSLDGQGRETIYQMKQVPKPHPFGIAIDGDVLYYSSWGAPRVVQAVNWRTGDSVAIAGPRGAHGQLYGVEIVQNRCPRSYNRCASSGCSHLCLHTPDGHVCKCPPGAEGCQ